MSKRAKIDILILLLLIVGATFAGVMWASRLDGHSPKEYLACVMDDGQWKLQSTVQGDWCTGPSTKNETYGASPALRYSCECGPEQCWDGDKKECVKNPLGREEDSYSVCEQGGGVDSIGSSTCADYCWVAKLEAVDPLGGVACSTDEAAICDCGSEKCWNEKKERCESNPS